MSRSHFSTLVAGLVVLVGVTVGLRGHTFAQPDPNMPTPEQIQEMMQQAMASAQPGDEHTLLDAMAGTWDVTIRAFGPDGAVGMEEQAKAVNTWILGGRFLECDAIGGSGEMRIESKMIIGFDRREGKEHYFAFGIDTLGTYAIQPVGHVDSESGDLIFEGTNFEPVMQMEQKYKMVFSFENKDLFVSDLHLEMPGGQLMHVFQMSHTRVK